MVHDSMTCTRGNGKGREEKETGGRCHKVMEEKGDQEETPHGKGKDGNGRDDIREGKAWEGNCGEMPYRKGGRQGKLCKGREGNGIGTGRICHMGREEKETRVRHYKGRGPGGKAGTKGKGTGMRCRKGREGKETGVMMQGKGRRPEGDAGREGDWGETPQGRGREGNWWEMLQGNGRGRERGRGETPQGS